MNVLLTQCVVATKQHSVRFVSGHSVWLASPGERFHPVAGREVRVTHWSQCTSAKQDIINFCCVCVFFQNMDVLEVCVNL